MRHVFVDKDDDLGKRRVLVKAYSKNQKAKRDNHFFIPTEPPACGEGD